MKIKTIRNQTMYEQFVVKDGKQHILGAKGSPDSEKSLPEDLANEFLERYKHEVIEVKGIGGEYVSGDDESQYLWIANVTGDPKASPTIRLKTGYSKQKGGWQWEDVTNPKRVPIEITRKMGGKMEEYVNPQDDVVEALNHFPETYVIPPYKRIRLPSAKARWLLNRDHRQSPEMRGCIIKSRPPSPFEPSESWSLDDMRLYLRMIDRDADIGPCENDIVYTRAKKKYKDADMKLYLARMEMLKTLYFYLVDPKQPLPTEREFKEFKNGAPEVTVEEDIESLLISASAQTSVMESQLSD